MRTTFSENLQDMAAAEQEAAKYFKGYKARTQQQIAADSALSAAHKETIANNASEIKLNQETKAAAEATLKAMEEQLATETAHLKEHTEFHDEATKESLALIEAIQKAITLLSSEDAKKTMAKSVDKMQYPTLFLQLAASGFELTTPGSAGRSAKLTLAQKKAMVWNKVGGTGIGLPGEAGSEIGLTLAEGRGGGESGTTVLSLESS